MRALLLLVLLVPMAAAESVATTRFIASSVSSDGSSQLGGTTEFLSLFGDSATRQLEAEGIVHAPFTFNITKFHFVFPTANCGDLAAADTVRITFRINQTNTIIQGNCTGGSPADTHVWDNDTLTVYEGSHLSYSVLLISNFPSRAPRFGITAQGYAETVDMTNEMLETLAVFLPFLLVILMILWAEYSQAGLVYVGATVASVFLTANLWVEMADFRIIFVAIIILIIARGVMVSRSVDT